MEKKLLMKTGIVSLSTQGMKGANITLLTLGTKGRILGHFLGYKCINTAVRSRHIRGFAASARPSVNEVGVGVGGGRLNIIPVATYSNADTLKAVILKDNKGKAGVYL